MKEIYLIRHAKSSWDSAYSDDFDRPLDERGAHDAPRMAAAIAIAWPRPDLVITSPAVRAYQTAQFFRKAWELPWDRFIIRSAIYEASPEALQWVLEKEAGSYDRVALVGHNPGISLFLNQSCGEDRELKTACAARLQIEKIGMEGKGNLLELRSPANL